MGVCGQLSLHSKSRHGTRNSEKQIVMIDLICVHLRQKPNIHAVTNNHVLASVSRKYMRLRRTRVRRNAHRCIVPPPKKKNHN